MPFILCKLAYFLREVQRLRKIVDRKDASQALNPIELGVNFIDTADTYGPEVSERLIAEAPSRCRAWSSQMTGLR
jgi:diketogulonate reductase-like aldo/keto reductase